jgi:hypothetical protein
VPYFCLYLTSTGNSEKCFETTFIPNIFSIGSINILIVPSFLYGCEISALKQRNIIRLKAAEIKFMRRTAEYNLLDHRRN